MKLLNVQRYIMLVDIFLSFFIKFGKFVTDS